MEKFITRGVSSGNTQQTLNAEQTAAVKTKNNAVVVIAGLCSAIFATYASVQT